MPSCCQQWNIIATPSQQRAYIPHWRRSEHHSGTNSKDISQLKSFLGLINCYSSFLPRLSHVMPPCTICCRKCRSGHGERLKPRLSSRLKKLWHHYECWLITTRTYLQFLTVMPPPAVLSHQPEDGVIKPIAFANRSLGPAEKSSG